MDLDKVKQFVTLAKNEGVHSLKYEEGDIKISVTLGGEAPVAVHMPVSAKPSSQTMTSKNTEKVASDLIEVTSPFVGTFYRSPAPDEPAFVNVGDKVSKGQVLCILEAMKIMNEIDCDASGEIAEICVDNESLVEYGQVLFKIRKN